MGLLRRLFSRKPEYVYGTAGSNHGPARRHRSGRVEFVLWKAGERGHTEDYWHAMHEDWWLTFKEGSTMTQHTDLIERLRDPLKNAFMPTRREAAAALEAQAREIEGLRKDAACFRFWVREAAVNPCDMAKLIMRCTTEQEYRDAIEPLATAAEDAIRTAMKGQP